jgi:hypothetical protein
MRKSNDPFRSIRFVPAILLIIAAYLLTGCETDDPSVNHGHVASAQGNMGWFLENMFEPTPYNSVPR